MTSDKCDTPEPPDSGVPSDSGSPPDAPDALAAYSHELSRSRWRLLVAWIFILGILFIAADFLRPDDVAPNLRPPTR